MKLGVIGLGYIGLNTSLFFAQKGVKIVGVDLDKRKVNALRKGKMPIPELNDWLEFKTEPLIKKYIKAVTNFDVLLKDEKVEAIFVAVPTEKDGEPYFKAIEAVVSTIAKSPSKNKLVIIESTLMPGVSEKYIAPYLKNFVVAPRRDWFEKESGKNLKTLPRIVGGSNEETTKKALEILGLVCDNLLPCNYTEAELIKAVENSIRHVGCVYAQQLAFAYPHLDTRKVLEYASTKWNVPYYYAAISCGGYCIPISSKYVMNASKNINWLTIPLETVTTDNYVPKAIAEIIEKRDIKRIGIAGISYLGNLKVSILSSGIRLIREFKDKNRLRINDPLYTDRELKKETGCKLFDFPKELKKLNALILAAGHNEYANVDKETLIENTKHMDFILDNTGIWEGIDFKCPYALVGRREWLNKIKGRWTEYIEIDIPIEEE